MVPPVAVSTPGVSACGTEVTIILGCCCCCRWFDVENEARGGDNLLTECRRALNENAGEAFSSRATVTAAEFCLLMISRAQRERGERCRMIQKIKKNVGSPRIYILFYYYATPCRDSAFNNLRGLKTPPPVHFALHKPAPLAFFACRYYFRCLVFACRASPRARWASCILAPQDIQQLAWGECVRVLFCFLSLRRGVFPESETIIKRAYREVRARPGYRKSSGVGCSLGKRGGNMATANANAAPGATRPVDQHVEFVVKVGRWFIFSGRVGAMGVRVVVPGVHSSSSSRFWGGPCCSRAAIDVFDTSMSSSVPSWLDGGPCVPARSASPPGRGIRREATCQSSKKTVTCPAG